jgi:hypothetical protein
MTQGYPLILARRSRRPDPAAPSNWIVETTGDPVGCGIEFGEEFPTFRNLRGVGHFLCIMQSTTEQDDLTLEVTAPAWAAQSWNRVEAKKVTWDQIISVPVTQSGTRGSILTLGTPEVMQRSLVCNSHLSLTWLVELQTDEQCVVTATGSPSRSWELAVIRMLPEGINEEFVEHRNLLLAGLPAVSNPNFTVVRLDAVGGGNLRIAKLIQFARITNISANPFSLFTLVGGPSGGVQASFPHDLICKVRKSATHPGGGSIRVRIQNEAGTVDYITATVAIPTDDSVVDVVYNGPAGGPFAGRVTFDNFAVGEQVEIGLGHFVVS